MSSLTVGAHHIERVIPNAETLLYEYRTDPGYDYLDYEPITSPDELLPEDLAVTLLMNSRVGWRAFQSLQRHMREIDISYLSHKPLEHTSMHELEAAAEVITKLAHLPGIAASVATKILHKKRPALIPILDNQAIFGAYMNPEWPQKPARNDSERNMAQILTALRWIHFDITRRENLQVWSSLKLLEPRRHRIELFDCIWWKYFRNEQPVK